MIILFQAANCTIYKQRNITPNAGQDVSKSKKDSFFINSVDAISRRKDFLYFILHSHNGRQVIFHDQSSFVIWVDQNNNTHTTSFIGTKMTDVVS